MRSDSANCRSGSRQDESVSEWLTPTPRGAARTAGLYNEAIRNMELRSTGMLTRAGPLTKSMCHSHPRSVYRCRGRALVRSLPGTFDCGLTITTGDAVRFALARPARKQPAGAASRAYPGFSRNRPTILLVVTCRAARCVASMATGFDLPQRSTLTPCRCQVSTCSSTTSAARRA